MENNLPAPNTPAGEERVLISRQEYERLTNTAPPPSPQIISNAPPPAPYVERPTTNMNGNQKILAALAISVILSVIFPVGIIFFIPVFIFFLLTVKGFFKSDPTKSAGQNTTSLMLRIIIAIVVAVGSVIAAGILLLILLFTAFAGSGQSS